MCVTSALFVDFDRPTDGDWTCSLATTCVVSDVREGLDSPTTPISQLENACGRNSVTNSDRKGIVKDPELIQSAIAESGISARRFAERILSRDERTVRRWSSGEIEIPPLARAWLERWLEIPEPARTRIVGTLDRDHSGDSK